MIEKKKLRSDIVDILIDRQLNFVQHAYLLFLKIAMSKTLVNLFSISKALNRSLRNWMVVSIRTLTMEENLQPKDIAYYNTCHFWCI